MTCPHCSAENAPGAPQCLKCGQWLSSSVDVGATMPPRATAAARSGAEGPTMLGGWTAVGVASSHGSVFGDSARLSGQQVPVDFGPRYQIEALLGEGGMGAVYRAHDRDLDRTVALKLIRPGIAADPTVSLRLKQELLLASKVSHKNILRIHDLGEANGMKFISMAYVEGEDLQHLLEREGSLPTERALSIARQLCAALEAAHSEGVVHRDLKPQNILVGKSDHVYVADFGLAKSLEAGLTQMTRSGEVLGTPLYMAPEQVECKPIDHRTDLYALGLIFYQMVTGDLPFKADSAIQLMFQRVQQKPKDPRTINPAVPEYLARIIMRCLEKDPASRYQSAADILRDLESARAPVGAHSVQISIPGISLQVPSRISIYLAAGAALLVLVAVLLSVPWVRRTLWGGRTDQQGQSQNVRYVAVLPFRVQGDERTGGLVAEGVTEALTAKLFNLKDVRLTSGAADVKPNDPLEKIGKALGANLIVSGTVQASANNKIRIIANLDDVATRRRVWTAEFPGVSDDLLTLEDQVYAQLLTALAVKPTNEELASTTGHSTENVEAYDLYLRGRKAMRGQQDINNVRKAISYYEDALKKDPRFALAYTGLAGASLRMYSETKDPGWSAKALSAAQRALDLNDRLPQAHSAAGEVYTATGRSAEGIAELKQAVQMAPNADEGYRRLARAYLDSGRSKEAIDTYQKAVEVNPFFWMNYNDLGVAYFRLGKYEDAAKTLRRILELEPDNADGYNNLATALLGAGEFQQAIEPLQKAIQLTPTADAYSNLGTALFYLKRYAEAVPYFEKAAEMVPNSVIFVGNVGDGYSMAGRQQESKEKYDKAIALAYKGLQVNPRDAITMGAMANWYAKEGNLPQAQKFIQQARGIDPTNVDLMYFQAQIYTLANDHPNALAALEEAFKQGFRPAFAEAEPALAGLRADPQFGKLVKKYVTK